MKVKKGAKLYCGDDLYYDFFDGGYLDPEDILENKEDIMIVDGARRILERFFAVAVDDGEE
jgi:hypothetical protein